MIKRVTNSHQRIEELMDYYSINQTELCKRTGLQKSALSNYLNSDREPRLNQLVLIIDSFNINPAWLMGYDVPMYNSMDQDIASCDNNTVRQALELYEAIENLSQDKKDALYKFLKFLQSNA